MSKTSIKILVAIPAATLLILAALYFLFPGTVFQILLNSERKSAGLEQKSVDVDNVHYEYLEGGKGEVLVLLHGFGGNKDNWTRIAKYLIPYFRVIAPDLQGFGESSRDKDRVLHVSAAKKLESVMPNAKSVIMKDVGHVPMVEQPEASANIFLRFLGKK